MLVLSRKRNEKVRIGRNIHLVIVDIRGDKVRFGIEAPDGWPVHREEVFNAIEREGDTISDPLESALRQIALQQTIIERLKAELESAA